MKSKLYITIAVDMLVIVLYFFILSRMFIRVGFISRDPLIIAVTLATTLAVMAFLVCFNLIMLLKARQPALIVPVNTSKISTLEDCLSGARGYMTHNGALFAEQINAVISQVERIQRKRSSTERILSSHFEETEMSYPVFISAIEKLEELFVLSVKTMLHRLNSFDDKEYRDRTGARFMSETTLAARDELYNEHVRLSAEVLRNNEEILLKFDKLSLELSKIGTMDSEEIVRMLEINEIDRIIRDTKYYK